MWAARVLGSFFIMLAVHALLCRIAIPGNSVIKFFCAGFLAGLGLIVQLVRYYGCDVRILSPVFLYAFICEVYVFLFTFVGTSVSASLLFSLKEKPLSLDQIEKVYSSHGMVEQRIQKLIQEGLLGSSSAGRVVTKKGQRVLSAFRTLQSFFGHRSDIGMPRSSKAGS